MPANPYQLLPSIDQLLRNDNMTASLETYGRNAVVACSRIMLESCRASLAQGDIRFIAELESADFIRSLCDKIDAQLTQQNKRSLTPVINLTGTVVHTNLGRASLPANAVKAMTEAATNPTNLEFDLASGRRGDRDNHLEKALCEITGAESATVVNNNAAAVMLVLNSLALGQEVPISRGELVEIGGSFRIPDVMQSAGCHLLEIGTTNRTHLKDYQQAISERTGLLMKVHTSNYAIQGFTKEVSNAQLAQLAAEKELPFVNDLGSGTLIDLRQFGLPFEPTVAQTIEEGADVVTFSGDKLLGGPQAGIIAGKKDLIDKIKQNPLKRALRIDKIILAALLETINLYKDPNTLADKLPLLRDLTRSLQEIGTSANTLLPAVQKVLSAVANVEIADCKSQIGSGSLPLELLDSKCLCITPFGQAGQTDANLQVLAAAFRQLPIPVIGRVKDGSLLFDLRCLTDEQVFIDQLEQLVLLDSH